MSVCHVFFFVEKQHYLGLGHIFVTVRFKVTVKNVQWEPRLSLEHIVATLGTEIIV
jgi:hypothetical protein